MAKSSLLGYNIKVKLFFCDCVVNSLTYKCSILLNIINLRIAKMYYVLIEKKKGVVMQMCKSIEIKLEFSHHINSLLSFECTHFTAFKCIEMEIFASKRQWISITIFPF